MSEVHLKLEPDHMPKTVSEVVEYLREMACVHPESGMRRMPNFVDDQVFDAAADLIEAMSLALEPFAREAKHYSRQAGTPSIDVGFGTVRDAEYTMADLRNARMWIDANIPHKPSSEPTP